MRKIIFALTLVFILVSCNNRDMDNNDSDLSNTTPSPLIGTWKADNTYACSVLTFGENNEFALDLTHKHLYEPAIILTGKYTDKNTYFYLYNIKKTNKDNGSESTTWEPFEWPYRIEDEILYLPLPQIQFDVPHNKVIQ